jgi:hypothetical protein
MNDSRVWVIYGINRIRHIELRPSLIHLLAVKKLMRDIVCGEGFCVVTGWNRSVLGEEKETTGGG